MLFGPVCPSIERIINEDTHVDRSSIGVRDRRSAGQPSDHSACGDSGTAGDRGNTGESCHSGGSVNLDRSYSRGGGDSG
jgi:hypothetical protein